MEMTPFTRNYEDNSTDAGFQFTFYCDICQDGYKTKFIESKTYKKGSFFKTLGRGVAVGASLFGISEGYEVERGTDIISERFEGMSPEWHREHEHAFELAQNEAKGHFHRCHNCHLWVCEDDFNEEEGLCVECAPRMNVKIAKAKAEKMEEDIKAKAEETTVFDGKIESKQIMCPNCGKPSGQGKFCNNCGANLTLKKCPACGTKNQAEARFCSECGEKLC